MVGRQNVYINILWATALVTLRTTALKGSKMCYKNFLPFETNTAFEI